MAAQVKLEPRDHEILRALLRVRYLTTRQIGGAFFSCPRVARRRIHRLSEYDLIRPHTKGMPDALRYTAWRLTRRGLDALAHAFPDEPVPDGLIDRVASGSLHHALHREALADLYLGLVVPDRAGFANGDLSGHRRWVAEMRRRADALTWQPDGDVVLSVWDLGKRVDVMPDAVVRSPQQGRRIFIELDRSTKDLGRIQEGLARYNAVLSRTDLDGDVPHILFVVRSDKRKENIQGLSRHRSLVALRDVEAVEWLREELLAIPPAPSKPKDEGTVDEAARRVYSWARRLDRVLRASGVQQIFEQAEPALMHEGHEQLQALYRALKAVQDRGARS
jgi:Replication-relaxation